MPLPWQTPQPGAFGYSLCTSAWWSPAHPSVRLRGCYYQVTATEGDAQDKLWSFSFQQDILQQWRGSASALQHGGPQVGTVLLGTQDVACVDAELNANCIYF